MGNEPPLQPDVDLLEVCVTDTCGIRRCKTTTRDYLPDVLRSGLGFASVAMYLPPYGDIPADGCSYTATGEYRIVPDMTTFKKLPWRNNTGHVFGDLYAEDGKPAAECPRGILRRSLDLLKNEFGFDLKIGFETEFVLLKTDKKDKTGEPRPLCEQPYGSQNDMVFHAEVIEDIIKTLQQLDIDIWLFHPESASGQYEIVTGPADPVSACDTNLLTRCTIVAIAAQHGFEVTFLPKYYAMAAGSGLHVHMSLSKDGSDVSLGSEPGTLSNATQYFIDGLLKHLREYIIWTGSTPGSFSRYAPGCWSGFLTVWGINNREAMVRVLFPAAGVRNSIHFEHRCLDSTANIYIGTSALILAGILGLRNKELLPPPTQGFPSTLTDQERTDRRAMSYPRSMQEAIEAFEQSTDFKRLLIEVSSENYVAGAIAVRRSIGKFFTPFDHTADELIQKERKLLYNRY